MKLLLGQTYKPGLLPETSVKLTPWESAFVARVCDVPATTGNFGVLTDTVTGIIDACWKWEDKIVTYHWPGNSDNNYDTNYGLHRMEADRKDKLLDKLHFLLGTSETWNATWPIQRKAAFLQRIIRPMKWVLSSTFHLEGSEPFLRCESLLYTFGPSGSMTWIGPNWANEAKAWLEADFAANAG